MDESNSSIHQLPASAFPKRGSYIHQHSQKNPVGEEFVSVGMFDDHDDGALRIAMVTATSSSQHHLPFQSTQSQHGPNQSKLPTILPIVSITQPPQQPFILAKL